MDRKDFIKSAGCLCGAGALASILMTAESCAPKMYKATITSGKAVIPTSLFATEKIQVVRIAGLEDNIAVVQNEDGTYSAYEMKCTHKGASLKLKNDEFACPLHGSKFFTNGDVKNGPAEKALKKYAAINTGTAIEVLVG